MTTLPEANPRTRHQDQDGSSRTLSGLATIEIINTLLSQLQVHTGHDLHHYQTTTDEDVPYGLDFWQAIADLLTEVQQLRVQEGHLQVQANVLQASEWRYRHLADAMPHLVWRANKAGVVEYYNVRIYDYDAAVRQGAGFDWQRSLHPDDLAPTLATWQTAVIRGEPYSCEHRLRMANGSWRWHLSRAVLVRDGDHGDLWYGTATDIHERKLAEEALYQSNAMLTAMLEGTSDAIFVRDLSGRYLLVNTAGAEQVRMPKEALISQRYTDLFSAAEVATMTHDDRPVLEQGLTQSLEHVTEHNGVVCYWHTLKMPLRNAHGEIIGLISSARNFTERKQMEEALRTSEARFRQLADAMPQIVWSTDAAGQIEYINAQWSIYSGMTLTESLEHDMWPAVHPDDLAENQAEWGRAITTGTTYEAEVRLRRIDGMYRWFLERAVPIRDEQGVIQQWVGASMDIHDRKEAEAILRRYQLLSDQARDIILFVRMNGQIVEANAAAVEAYGYKRPTLLTMTIYDLCDPATYPFLVAQMAQAEQAVAECDVRFETIHCRCDGNTFPVEVSSIGATVGNERLLLSVIRDISERKATEAALVASEAKFATAFNLSPLILTITTLSDGRLLDVNESFVRTTGYTPTEALGRTPDELGLWANPQERATKRAQVSVGEWVTDAEAVFRMKNGELKTCLLGAARVVISGQPCALTALMDITEHKQAEAALRASEERFSKAFHASPQPMCITRIEDGSYIDANESFARMVGYSRPEILRRTSLEIGIWANREERSRTNEVILRQGGNRDFVHHFHDRYGEWHEIVAAGQLIELEEQACILSVIEDVTQRKQAEQALRTSEERLRLAVEATGLGIWEMYPDSGAITWSAQCKMMHGLPVDTEITRQIVKTTIYPADLEAVQSALRAFYAPPRDRELNTEHRIVRTDGTVRWIQVQGRFIEDSRGAQPPQRSLGTMLDVTERRQAEEAIAAGRRFLARIAQAIPDSLMVYDLSSQRIIFHNPMLVKVLGLSNEQSLAHTQHEIDERVHPDDAQRVQEEFAALYTATDDDVVEVSFRYRFPDGEYHWLQERTVVFVRDEAGAVIQHLSVSRDITERKQAEEALVRAHHAAERTANRLARLQQITTALTGAATPAQLASAVIQQSIQATGTRAGILVELLDNGQELRTVAALGYPAAAVRTDPVPLSAPTPISDCLRTGQAVWLRSHQEFAAQYPTLAELRRSFGNEATAVVPLTMGNRMLGALAFSYVEPHEFDIEEREFFFAVAQQCAQAWERTRLYEAEQTARTIAEQTAARITRLQTITMELSSALTSAQVVEIILHHGRLALAAATMEVTLLSTDGLWLETVGKRPADLAVRKALPQRTPIAMSTPVTEAVRTGEPIWLASWQALIARYPDFEKEKATLDLEAICAIPLSLGSRILGSLEISFAHVVDFSTNEQDFLLTLARQCAQAIERARLYEVEQQARVELEVRVQERTAELERSNRELGQFAYVAAHDLRTPLHGIRHLANWIEEDASAVLPERSKTHLFKLRRRVQRMERLLDDLLAYSRAGHFHYSPESVNTATLVHEITELLAPPTGFTVSVVETMPTLITERIPLTTIFHNLLSNALKHHHQPTQGHVWISAADYDDWIEFRVRDNGPGIEFTYHTRIFQMFQTLQPRDQVEGSGMGLALVKKLVESYGGQISVESTVGLGATFCFTWPKHL